MLLKQKLKPILKKAAVWATTAAMLVTSFTAGIGGLTASATSDNWSSHTEAITVGSGSQADPYLISTPGQLAYLAEQVNSDNTYAGKYVVLTDDIDLTGKDWTPIGISDAHVFDGTFNGCGNEITGLTISGDLPFMGLFGYADSSSLIENVRVDATLSSTGSSAVGGIAGSSNGNIVCCSVAGSVEGGDSSNDGGLVGSNGGSISFSYSTCSVTGNTTANGASVGGIAGSSQGYINNCYTAGVLTGGDMDGSYIGGIVGYYEEPDGAFGISNCYYKNDADTQIKGSLSQDAKGVGTDNAEAEATGMSYSDMTVGLVNHLLMYAGSNIQWYNTGSGTPILLFNWSQLADTSWYNTIDTSFTLTTPKQLAGLAKLVNNGTDSFENKTINISGEFSLIQTYWVPIGKDADHQFRGTLGAQANGQPAIMQNMRIGDPTNRDASHSCVGFLGYNGGTINNVIVSNASIYSTLKGACVSFLIGYNSGTVQSSQGLGYAEVGDSVTFGELVGENYGKIDGSGSAGAVTGANNCIIGGLVGTNASTIINCSAGGSVSAADGSIVGGFAGVNSGDGTDAGVILNSYASIGVLTGSTSSSYAGGFVGKNTGTDKAHGYINNIYTTGTATGGTGSITAAFAAQTTGQSEHIYTMSDNLRSQAFTDTLNTNAMSIPGARSWRYPPGGFPVFGMPMDQTPSLNATAAPGSTDGSTVVTVNGSIGTNHLAVLVSSSDIPTPAVNADSSAIVGLINNYQSGTGEITGVNATSNKYVGVYELDGTGKVVAFKEITLDNTMIKSPAPATPTLNVTVTHGTATGSTNVNVSNVIDTNNHLGVYVSSSQISTPNVGEPAPTAAPGFTNNYDSGTDITGVSTDGNKFVCVYELDSSDNVVAFKEIPFGSATIGSGTSSETLYYSVNDNGKLTVTGGSGTALNIPTTIKIGGVDKAVTSIADNAFSSNTEITSLTVPASVTSIGDSAFSGCDSLVNVTFGAGSVITEIGDHAFAGCKDLTGISVPANVTEIGDSAFSGCTSLGSTTFAAGSKLDKIDVNAFAGCTALSGISIPASVAEISDGAFMSCTALNTVTFGSGSTLESIGDAAFTGCTSLSSINIPASVTTIGDGILSDCTSLTAITIGSANSHYKVLDGVLYTIDGTKLVAYPDGNGYTEFTVPSGVTDIGYGSLANSSLSAVFIPASVNSIEDFAFYDDSNLTAAYFYGDDSPSMGILVFESDTVVYCTDSAKTHFGITSGTTGTWYANTDDSYDSETTVLPAYPAIGTQPAAQSVAPGGTATFSAGVTVSSGTAVYQWQRSTDGGKTWSTVSGGTGADTDTYKTAALSSSDNGALYRCLVSNTENGLTVTVPTKAVTLTVGGGSGGSAPAAPIDKTIPGTPDTGSSTSAKITPDDTNSSTVNNVIVNLGNVTVTAPASVLNSALGDDSSSWLKLTQGTTAETTQAAITAAATTENVIPITTLDLDLTRFYSNGTSEPIHNLSGSIDVVIKLTDAQIAAITDVSKAHLLYYDTSTGKFTDMSATFDLTSKTAKFSTNHFSTFVIATGENATTGNIGVTYDSHIQNIAWQPYVNDGKQSGTTGKGLRLEAVNVKLTGEAPSGASIVYQTYVQGTGWQKAVSNGAQSGTTGKCLRVEALRISLSGLNGYSVKYRVHIQNLGWQDWKTTANGTDISSAALAGTQGKKLRVEAVEIVIEKN
jgi:hypothetical protein